MWSAKVRATSVERQGRGYDAGGNLAEQRNPDGTVLKGSYDGEDRLTGPSLGSKAWGFSYDAGGRRTRTDLPGAPLRVAGLTRRGG